MDMPSLTGARLAFRIENESGRVENESAQKTNLEIHFPDQCVACPSSCNRGRGPNLVPANARLNPIVLARIFAPAQPNMIFRFEATTSRAPRRFVSWHTLDAPVLLKRFPGIRRHATQSCPLNCPYPGPSPAPLMRVIFHLSH